MASILIVEPDKLLADNLKKYLKGKNHKVGWRASAQSAIDYCDTETPDAIILELQLAGHSGVEFLYELRSYPEWQSVAVILYTTLTEPQIAETKIIDSPLNISSYLPKHSATLDDIGQAIQLAKKIKTV